MGIYLDNAATTQIDPLVLESMMPYLTGVYGNPSSIHSEGRKTRSAIEKARKKMADLLSVSPAEIFFTSGATESDNTAILSSIDSFGITTAITSQLEHHAVLHTLQFLEKSHKISLKYVDTDVLGNINYEHLDELLKQTSGTALVSLMHGNNEIGNITDIVRVGEICAASKAIFHSDTVQTISQMPINLQAAKLDFIVGSAHKFHGPKGVGFLYVNGERHIAPFIHGGAQERNMRGGTENLAGIIGMATALELAIQEMESKTKYLKDLKELAIGLLQTELKGVEFNGESGNLENSLNSILNFSVPESDDNEMLLFNLDINGIAASGGSACASGSVIGSHVLNSLNVVPSRGHIRFSFSKNTTQAEVAQAIAILKKVVEG